MARFLLSPDFWLRTLRVLQAPRVRISLFGDLLGRTKFEQFSAPHPRLPFIKYKKWGVALLQLPDSFDEYLKKQSGTRRYRNKCVKLGYQFREVKAMDYLEDILQINRSAPERQGNPMSSNYLEADSVRSYFEITGGVIHGVFRSDGGLAAYHHPIQCGDMVLSDKLLGHADDLKEGVMYYLLTESVRIFIELRHLNRFPNWAMYDTFWGASAGMRQFKTKLGYAPYNVTWVWKEIPSAP